MSLLVTLNGLRLLRGRQPAHTEPSAESPGAPACADGCCTHD
jgi:hypothetical protein